MNQKKIQSVDKAKFILNVKEASLLYISIVILAIGVFIADFQTKLGIAVWVLYLIPLTLSYLSPRKFIPFVLASIITAFMTVNFYTDAKGINVEMAQINRLLGLIGIWMVAIIGFFFIRSRISIKKNEWLHNALAGLNETIAGNQNYQQLGKSVISFLVDHVDVSVGAFYVKTQEGFKLSSTYGVGKNGVPEVLEENNLVQASIEKMEIIPITDVPDDYLTYGSTFGNGKPKHLLIAPVYKEKKSNAVLELGFQKPINNLTIELLNRLAEPLSIEVQAAGYRENLKNYLEETQRQAEELQSQSEELRVSNEELAEQSNILQESQSMLEQQQAELEQNNAQLEEQTQMLETQRDDLAKNKAELQLRANELEEASQYKSDFLANMSHELRTPLNSTLILAKLLADNSDGNLTNEQIKYAKTIQSSGNDLLTLINDILDLSKIEAGHMQIDAEKVRFVKILESINNNFAPMAQEKGLNFTTELSDDLPTYMTTDSLRFNQVLKNLLSNAFKFTSKGEIKVKIEKADEENISFAIIDTGIGIAAKKLDLIFQAFQQADGTTNRKFGGTGLGLSISKELARLLGGEISVVSVEGKGSTFTVTVPITYSPENVSSRTENPQNASVENKSEIITSDKNNFNKDVTKPLVRTKNKLSDEDVSNDDRDNLSGNKRVVLIVEDDKSFASILQDLAHDLGFDCLVAYSAEEGLDLFSEYNPHAVLLDVNLPDHSGLSVLDSIKQNPQTRHVPVHVLSSEDYSQTALAMGAMGFLSKPVKSDDLKKVLNNLETRLNQSVRRVLLVEDNKVQRESVKKLLAAPGVEIIGVGTVKSCLAKLKKETFDCMILDLTLPDDSGYALLEKLSEEEAYSFPPVIVYTGKDITPEEEQKLSRYSHSIIIKGAKSPERLLDEVTLFLHKMLSDLRVSQQRMIKEARNRDSALEGKKILVVEDDIRNIYSLTSILEPKGAIIDVARNGKEAVDYINNKYNAKPDLVLMDIMMPEMDGYTAMRKIRQNKEMVKLPIIALTAKAMKDDQKRCLDAGANDYMAKPLDVDKLLSLVRVWVTR